MLATMTVPTTGAMNDAHTTWHSMTNMSFLKNSVVPYHTSCYLTIIAVQKCPIKPIGPVPFVALVKARALERYVTLSRVVGGLEQIGLADWLSLLSVYHVHVQGDSNVILVRGWGEQAAARVLVDYAAGEKDMECLICVRV